MLEEAEQDEFDRAFVGMQIIKHSMMVAELESMQNVGSQEFQQLVSTASQKTREHLQQARKVYQKLDGETAGEVRQATTPGARSPN